METGATVSQYQVTSLDQAEAAGGQIAALTIQLNAIIAKQNRIEFASQRCAEKAGRLREKMARYEDALREWAHNNRALMGDKKSLQLRHVLIFFKLCPPAVKLLENWDLKKVIQTLFKSRKYREYVRVKHELDRQRILGDSKRPNPPFDAKGLKRFGLAIAQEEKFYVEAKLTPSIS